MYLLIVFYYTRSSFAGHHARHQALSFPKMGGFSHFLRVDPATNDISKRFDFARVSREIKILETSEKNKSYMDRSGGSRPST